MKKQAYGLLVWFIATLFVIYAFCLNTAASVFEESIQASLHASKAGVSTALGAFIVGFACMQIPAGYLLDRFNPRYVVSAGILILAMGNWLISFSDTLLMFSLANLLQGMGGSFAFIAVAVLISQWFSAPKFPIMFGLTQTLSCILSGFIHSWMAAKLVHSSWNAMYQGLGTFGLGLFVLSLLVIRSPSDHVQPKPLSLWQSVSKVAHNKQIMLCMVGAACSFGVLLAYAGYWFLTIQQHYDVKTADAYFISSLIFTGIGVGTPLWGVLSNRARSRSLMLHLSLVIGTMLLLAGIYLPHFDSHSLLLINTVSFFIGFFLSGSMLFYTVVSESCTDEVRGVALSFTNTGVFLLNAMMMFIPLLLISNTSPTFYTYLWILPFTTLISVLLLYFVKESYPTTIEESSNE